MEVRPARPAERTTVRGVLNAAMLSIDDDALGRGTTLVAAAARRERLTAGFDSGIRPFYESLGFDVERSDGRCRGVR